MDKATLCTDSLNSFSTLVYDGLLLLWINNYRLHYSVESAIQGANMTFFRLFSLCK